MSARRHRFFDVAVEDPDLLKADTRARRRGRAPTGPAGPPEPKNPPTRRNKQTQGSKVPDHRRGDAGPKSEERARRTRAGRKGQDRVPEGGRAQQPARSATAGKAMRSSGPVIDPRIAARRARVQAEEAAVGGRRRRRMAGLTVGLVVVSVAGAFVLLSPVASVRTIEVDGAQRTGSDAVRKASGLASRPPLVRVDERRVAAKVAALPWVQRVRVDRRWPRTVVLSVEESQPAAIAPCGAGGSASCLVDVRGRVLAATSEDTKVAADLPRLTGVPSAGEPGVSLPEAALGPLAVAVALPAALRPLVLGVRGVGDEVTLDLRAPGREATPPVVRLGNADRIPDKLTAAATVLARTSVNGVAILDVRVPESPALTRVRR